MNTWGQPPSAVQSGKARQTLLMLVFLVWSGRSCPLPLTIFTLTGKGTTSRAFPDRVVLFPTFISEAEASIHGENLAGDELRSGGEE